MKVIRPVPVTTAALVSSSVPEADYAEWSATPTYAVGDQVMKASVHRNFKAATSSHAIDPTTPGNTAWIDIGPTNRWAMFDEAVGTSTEATGSIEVVIAPGFVDALAIIDTDADHIQVTAIVSGSTLYNVTLSTNVSGGAILDWYDYFFADIGKVRSLIFYDLPLYDTAEIHVNAFAAGPSEPVAVGTVVVGRIYDLGLTEAGPSVGITDFSKKQTDDFGATTVVERAWAKRMTTRALLETSAVDGVQRQLAALRARPAVWIGEEGFDSLTIYGFFKDFSIDLALANISYCSLTIEGLI